jgi:hypothetical protein
LPTRRLKRWQTPFSRTGSLNWEFRRKYIPTEGRNSSINFEPNSSSYSTFDTQKHHLHILSAMLKLKC